MAKFHDADTAVARVDPLVGSVFDKRFRVAEKIATGGFGAIYRAQHVKSGHEIALKVLLPELAQDLGVVARFRREGATLTALRNPHTIAAYELGQAADKTLFIVMELLHGESVFERYTDRGPFEWKRMVKIAREVCESLGEAHALGIVHRDLKPTNIHLEQHDGDPDYVKVLDFGIAKILRGSDFDASDLTNAGQMIGTLDYMSPEQMVGGTITGQTDIYTLGIVLYEMIGGATPFPQAASPAAALHAMLKTRPQPLSARTPVPTELDHIVTRCLEREVTRRYRTVHELHDALGRLLDAGVSDAKSTRPVEVLEKTAEVLEKSEDDATAITPPPEHVLEDLRATNKVPKQPLPEWTDEDEHAPTSHRRPDLRPLPRQKHTPIPQLVAAPFSQKPRPLAPPPPAPSPPPPPPPPLHHMMRAPSQPPLPNPHAVPTPAPLNLYDPMMMQRPSNQMFAEPAPRPSFDMGQLAAREAAIRRFIWIAVLAVGAILGIAFATLL